MDQDLLYLKLGNDFFNVGSAKHKCLLLVMLHLYNFYFFFYVYCLMFYHMKDIFNY